MFAELESGIGAVIESHVCKLLCNEQFFQIFPFLNPPWDEQLVQKLSLPDPMYDVQYVQNLPSFPWLTVRRKFFPKPSFPWTKEQRKAFLKLPPPNPQSNEQFFQNLPSPGPLSNVKPKTLREARPKTSSPWSNLKHVIGVIFFFLLKSLGKQCLSCLSGPHATAPTPVNPF